MNWKALITAGALCTQVSGPASGASGCQQAHRIGESIDLRGGRKLTVVEQTIVDTAAQSTLRQTLLVDGGQPVTQEDARLALMEMFERAKMACRRYPLTGALIFLFGNKDAVVGTNWLARLDTRSGMTPSIDVRPALFSGGSTAAMCDGPNASRPKFKEYRSPDDITLPAMSMRKVLGTWPMTGGDCSRSFEEVSGRVPLVRADPLRQAPLAWWRALRSSPPPGQGHLP